MSSFLERTLIKYGFRPEKEFNAAVEEAVKREIDKVHLWLAETADAQRFDMPQYSPDPVYANQSDLYRLSPLLGSALDILADDVGLTKFNVSRMVGEEERDIPNHEFEVLLRTPNPVDSGLEFMRDTTIGYKLNGNHVWWLNRSGPYEKPSEIWPIPFENIIPIPDQRMYLLGYDYFPGMGKDPIRLPVWQIVHFKTYNPHNRFVGLSPIESLAMTITGNQGMRKTKAQTYTTYNGSPPDILAFKEYPNNEAWEDIKRNMREAAERNRTMMLRGVGDGVTWMSRAMSSKDAEFVQQMQQDMIDVFNRMCPGLLAMLSENATEANALAARATYSEKSLWKTLETFAQKITADILPAYGRKLIGHYDDPRVVDRKLELEEQSAYERTHTVEEVRREKYGDDPLGDERDKLFPSEISTKTPRGFEQPEQDDSDMPQENDMAQETSGDDVAMKAALEDLKKLRTMALRGKAMKANSFTSVYIPSDLLIAVKRDALAAKSKEDIARVFDMAANQLRPKRKVDPMVLLQGIELGVRALEMSKQ